MFLIVVEVVLLIIVCHALEFFNSTNDFWKVMKRLKMEKLYDWYVTSRIDENIQKIKKNCVDRLVLLNK